MDSHKSSTTAVTINNQGRDRIDRRRVERERVYNSSWFNLFRGKKIFKKDFKRCDRRLSRRAHCTGDLREPCPRGGLETGRVNVDLDTPLRKGRMWGETRKYPSGGKGETAPRRDDKGPF